MEGKKKLFHRDFLLVVIGQIISLFGNAILRFALPLYLLNQTGSAALFGTVSAIAFIPMIILCPIGGIIADRINKKKIMVVLDFATAAITAVLCLLLGRVDIVLLLLSVLILLYGIQGTYQPAVQASIPALTEQENLMPANAVINVVSSLSSLIGPVAGGAVYSFFGIMPILYISVICFMASAIMEIFIQIPFVKQQSNGKILPMGWNDLKESFRFMKKDTPCIWKVCLLVAGINMFMSALIMIGLPIIVTQSLGLAATKANQLYGYAEGSLAAGSLIGAIMAGTLSKKLKVRFNPTILFFCTLTILPIALALQFVSSPMASYVIIIFSCFFMLLLATLFSVQMMAYLQILTPDRLIGKVISCSMCVGMCATPLGQAMYGNLFEACKNHVYIPFYGALVVGLIITYASVKVFREVDQVLKTHKGIE